MHIDEKLMKYGLIPASTVNESSFRSISALRREPSLPVNWESFASMRKRIPWLMPYMYLSLGFEPLTVVNPRIAMIMNAAVLLDGHCTQVERYKKTVAEWLDKKHSLLWMRKNNSAAFEKLSWSSIAHCPTGFMELSYQLIPWSSTNERIRAHQRRCALEVRKREEYPSPSFDTSLRRLLRTTTPDPEMEIVYHKPVCIWRGESAKSTRLGMSWTTDRDIAMFFARRFAAPKTDSGILRSCVVPSNAILASYADDPEHEVLINPRLIDGRSVRKEAV